MKTIVFALLQIILSAGILYGYYHLFLRNKRFHQYNRFYLLAATIISVTIPFFQIPVYFDATETGSSIVLQTLTDISYTANEETIAGTAPVKNMELSWFTWQHILTTLYITVAALLLLKILFSLIKIFSIIKKNPVEKTAELNFVNTNEPGTPFSFFRWLFWDRNIDLQSAKGEQVFRHEVFHIREKHSLDVLFLEFITVVFWINPFFHLIRKEIKAIHEFLADQHASQGNNKWEYAELLLMQALNTRQSLVNPFFHNQIKRRIAMITTSKKSSYQYLRKLLVLPVATVVIGLFAFTYKNEFAEIPGSVKDPVTVIIDAGHGGIDPGVKSSDGKYTEATLSLEMAKAIQSVAGEYNIKVIMTRENEQLPGGAATIDEGLKQRLAIANNVKASAFLSIHINAAAPSVTSKKLSGIEAYVSNKKAGEKGTALASSILQKTGTVYKTDEQIKSRKESGVYILDKSTIPSVILQCGMINNPDDIAFITNKDNQEKLARKIMEGLVEYFNNGTPATANYTGNLNDTIPGIVKKAGPDKNGVYEKVEIDAAFPGGKDKWKEYLKKNLDANIAAKNNAPIGQYSTFIQFIVEKDGSIRDIKALTNHGYGIEQEAIRIIKTVPKWLPAINFGQPVNAYFKQRIDFKVPDKKTAGIGNDANLLREVVLVAYTTSKAGKETSPRQTTLSATEAGSLEWAKFLERNVSATTAVNEGWEKGSYRLLIEFVRKKDGSLSDMKALTYGNSAIAKHCIAVMKNIQGTPPGKTTVSSSQHFIQPFIIQIEDDNKPPVTTLHNNKLPANQSGLHLGLASQLEIKNKIRIVDNRLIARAEIETGVKKILYTMRNDKRINLGELGLTLD